MQTPSDRFSVWQHRAPAVVLALSLACCVAPAAWAQAEGHAKVSKQASAAHGSLSAGDRKRLRQELEPRFEAFAITNGVLLRARQERLGVRTVEVSGDSVVVNGAKVGPEVLRSWMGDADADLILRLLSLPPGDRQEVFGFKRSATTTAPVIQNPEHPSADERAAREEDETTEAPPRPTSPTPPTPPEPALAPTPPTPPTSPTPPTPPAINTGSRVRFGGGVTVERNEVADDVVAFGGPVHVEGEVSHDVMSFGGSIRINGRVAGDVHSFGGGVHLGPHAEVMGDISSSGGGVTREPGSRVHGTISEGNPFSGLLFDGRRDHEGFRRWPAGFLYPFGLGVGGRLSTLLMLAALVALAMLVARGTFERVDFELATQFWKALLAGILAQILFLPLLAVVSVVLLISVIGCALFLLYPIIFVALLLMALVGFAAACHRTGRWLETRFSWRLESPWAALFIGFVVIESWSLFAGMIRMGGSHLWAVAQMFSLFGFAVRYVAWTAGFGGALLAYSRQRRIRRSGVLTQPGEPMTSSAPPLPPPAPPLGGGSAAAPGGSATIAQTPPTTP
jgi:hypothetical protein